MTALEIAARATCARLGYNADEMVVALPRLPFIINDRWHVIASDDTRLEPVAMWKLFADPLRIGVEEIEARFTLVPKETAA